MYKCADLQRICGDLQGDLQRNMQGDDDQIRRMDVFQSQLPYVSVLVPRIGT